MDEELQPHQYEFLTRPFVDAWIGMLGRAGEAKKEFSDRAEMCEAFYSKSSGFMWQNDFKTKYIGSGISVPKYNVTVNTAFEYVSRFGPRLYWQNPRRRVTRPFRPEMDPAAIAGTDPMLGQYLEELQQQQGLFDARSQQANQLWECYLNYTPAEMPDGGLENHSRLAIDEALVTGRGILMARSYLPPGGTRRLTGCFHVPVHDLFIDPDCSSPLLSGCKWIAVRHVTPYWELEERFGWPRNSLRRVGQFESGNSQGSRPKQKAYQKDSNTPCDLVVWYEIWSKAGIGSRFVGTKISNKEVWDDICDDYCYLCVTQNLKSPLNLPAWWLAGDVDEDDVRKALEWPVPLWKDGRWPISMLDFYHEFNGPWPLAPLSAAMGEMICLQILLALYLQNAEANTQQIVAYLDSAAKQVEEQIRSGRTPAFVKIEDGTQKSISEIIQFVQRPNQNTDVIGAMEFLMQAIERKTGLSALLYGDNPGGAQDRSAEATRVKSANVTLIPDFMGKRVAAWQGDAADKERLTAYYAGVSGTDIEPLMGPMGAIAWDQLVSGEEEETVLRGMRARVEASDLRKPDKERDSSNLQSVVSYVVPALMQYGQATGDFEPWNGFIRSMANSMEMDTTEWEIPSQEPQQDGSAEAQQQQMAMQQQMAQEESARKAAESEMNLKVKQVEAAIKQRAAEADLGMRGQLHQQQMLQNAQRFWQQMQTREMLERQRQQQQRTAV